MPELRLVIDIGSDTVKVIEGGMSRGKLVVTRAGVVKNPLPEFWQGASLQEQASFTKFLRSYLQHLGVRSSLTMCGIAGEETLVHYFDLPDIPEEEIQSTVETELAEVFPQGWANLEFDYQILSSSGKKTVLLAGYPKNRCDFLIQIFSQCGLRLVLMTLDSLSLANLFYFQVNRQNEEIGFLINVGARLTSMALVERDGFVLARDIGFGGNDITRVISQQAGCSFSEAEARKKKPEEIAWLKELVRQNSVEMVSEVKTAVSYFTNRTGKKPEKFLLSGGSAVLPGLKETLEQNLNLPGEIWNPLQNISGVPGPIEQQGNLFAVSSGLLLWKLP